MVFFVCKDDIGVLSPKVSFHEITDFVTFGYQFLHSAVLQCTGCGNWLFIAGSMAMQGSEDFALEYCVRTCLSFLLKQPQICSGGSIDTGLSDAALAQYMVRNR